MMPNKESIKEADNIILMSTGGIGRNIMITAVVRNLKQAYPDKNIIVLAGSPDVFIKNPNIKRVIPLGQPSFVFEDYFLKSKSILVNVEPYQFYDYVYHRKHFVKCYCEMLGIECTDIKPEIFFSETEKKMGELFLKKYDKDIVLIQHTGGKSPENNSEKEKIASKAGMYKRSIPEKTVQEVTDGLINRGYKVLSVQLESQFCPSGADRISFNIRAMVALLPHVKQIITIDSFILHGAACFPHLSPIVLWGGTNPLALGYANHINMTKNACPTPMCHRPNSYLFDIESTGFMWDCPCNDACMNYSSLEVLKKFDETTGGHDSGKPIKQEKPSEIVAPGCGGCGQKKAPRKT